MSSDDKKGGLHVLPVLRAGDTAYFVDLRLRQFRETMNPHNYVDFDSPKGKELCRLAGVATCLRCGASVIVSGAMLQERIRCVRCCAVIGEEG